MGKCTPHIDMECMDIMIYKITLVGEQEYQKNMMDITGP